MVYYRTLKSFGLWTRIIPSPCLLLHVLVHTATRACIFYPYVRRPQVLKHSWRRGKGPKILPFVLAHRRISSVVKVVEGFFWTLSVSHGNKLMYKASEGVSSFIDSSKISGEFHVFFQKFWKMQP